MIALAAGCAPEPSHSDADLGFDASSDAHIERLDGRDALRSLDAPPESWTLERARTEYCGVQVASA